MSTGCLEIRDLQIPSSEIMVNFNRTQMDFGAPSPFVLRQGSWNDVLKGVVKTINDM